MSEKVNPSKLRSKKVKHPRFKRANVGKPDRRRLEDKWRKPRGEDNKQRAHRADRGALPNVGYRNPRALRGVHPSGYVEVLVRSLNDLQQLEGKSVAIRLASTIGKRKRDLLVSKAKEMGLKILN